MVAIPKVSGILSCGFLLCLGLSDPTSATDTMKASQFEGNGGEADQQEMTSQKQGIHVMQGDVLRIEGANYVVKGLDGKEVRLHADNTTVRTGNVKPGDRIEAKITGQNHALSLLTAP